MSLWRQTAKQRGHTGERCGSCGEKVDEVRVVRVSVLDVRYASEGAQGEVPVTPRDMKTTGRLRGGVRDGKWDI